MHPRKKIDGAAALLFAYGHVRVRFSLYNLLASGLD